MITTSLWRLRSLCLALCLVCLVSLGQPVAAAKQASQTPFIYTALVHNSASPRSIVIGQLEDSAIVTVLGQENDFFRIDCYDSVGYIAKSQVLRKRDGQYYVDCNPMSAETARMDCVSLADALLLRESILQLAKAQLGTPYVYGGKRPGGFDCSGLTSYVFQQNGYLLNRCAGDQMRNGLIVAKEGMQVGDLVFFRESWSPDLASHVGIYVGNDQIIHSRRGGVCYSDLNDDWYTKYFVGARRIVNVETIAVMAASAVSEIHTNRDMRNSGMRTIG